MVMYHWADLMEPFKKELPPDLEAKVVERLRAMTPGQRFQQMLDLNRFVSETQLPAIKIAHPDAEEFELKMRLASRWVKNPELLKAAFGWDVEVQGY